MSTRHGLRGRYSTAAWTWTCLGWPESSAFEHLRPATRLWRPGLRRRRRLSPASLLEPALTVLISDLPPTAAAASLALRDVLVDFLGDDLVALWLYGGTTFADRPDVAGDLDIAAVVAQASAEERDPQRWMTQPGSRPNRILTAVERTAASHGVSFDIAFFLAEDMGRGEPPGYAYAEKRGHTGWPVERAHWLAGQ